MDYEKTGALIQETRIKKGMTQAQLAECLGVTDKAISKWERGKSFPDVAMLKPLAQTLELSVLELLDGERKTEAVVSNEEAGETALKGIQVYVSDHERRQRIYKLAAAAVLLMAVIVFCLWKYSHRPVDFSQGVFDFGTVAVDQAEGAFVMDLDGGRYDQFVKERIKEFLAENTGQMKEVTSLPASQEWVHLSDPKNHTKNLVSFSPEGYADYRSGKYFTCDFSDSLYDELKSILIDFSGESSDAYQYSGKRAYGYQGRKLAVEMTPDSPVEELIVEDLRQRMKEDFNPNYPDAYTSEVRLQSIEWILPEEYDEDELYYVNKEIVYQELYDYRIYEVITEETYTDAKNALLPQLTEGRHVYLYLLGKKPSQTDFEVCYFQVCGL